MWAIGYLLAALLFGLAFGRAIFIFEICNKSVQETEPKESGFLAAKLIGCQECKRQQKSAFTKLASLSQSESDDEHSASS